MLNMLNFTLFFWQTSMAVKKTQLTQIYNCDGDGDCDHNDNGEVGDNHQHHHHRDYVEDGDDC